MSVMLGSGPLTFFFFFPSIGAGQLPPSQGLFSFSLWGRLPSPHTTGTQKRMVLLFVWLPAYCIHCSIQPVFSRLLAAVQLSFCALLPGVFWSQTLSEKRVYLHKQYHVRRSAGNKIKIQPTKSSWTTHFLQPTPPIVTICVLNYGWKCVQLFLFICSCVQIPHIRWSLF